MERARRNMKDNRDLIFAILIGVAIGWLTAGVAMLATGHGPDCFTCYYIAPSER